MLLQNRLITTVHLSSYSVYCWLRHSIAFLFLDRPLREEVHIGVIQIFLRHSPASVARSLSSTQHAALWFWAVKQYISVRLPRILRRRLRESIFSLKF